MIQNLLYRVSQLERKLANTIIVGTINDVDYDEALVRVESGDFISGWLPWLTTRAYNDKEYWAPEIAEQVIMFSPDGEPEQGVVLPALYQQTYDKLANNADIHIREYKDKSTFSFDRQSSKLTIALAGGGTTEFISDGGIKIKGDITVEGNVKATGDITDKVRSMAKDREIYNKHIHTISDHSEANPTENIQ